MSYSILTANAATIDDVITAYGSPTKLDLGCGYYKRSGYIGLDNFFGADSQVVTDHGPDIVIDLMGEPLPFADHSVDEVHASHFLEHVDISRMILEVHRVLKPGGLFHIVLPYANSAQGMYAGHTAFYTEQWFYLNKQFNDHFFIERIGWRKTPVYEELPRLFRLPFGLARRVYFNICDEFTIYCRPDDGTDHQRAEFVYLPPS